MPPRADAARSDVFEYIEVFYNRRRAHSLLGYETPTSFEACDLESETAQCLTTCPGDRINSITIQDVQNALTNDIQWYRIANNVWVVHTTQSSRWLFDRLSVLANPSGTLFVTRLDPRDRQGWMPKAFWERLVQRMSYGL